MLYIHWLLFFANFVVGVLDLHSLKIYLEVTAKIKCRCMIYASFFPTELVKINVLSGFSPGVEIKNFIDVQHDLLLLTESISGNDSELVVVLWLDRRNQT